LQFHTLINIPQEYFLSDYWIEDCRRGMAQRTLLFAAEARSQRGRRQAALWENAIAEHRRRLKEEWKLYQDYEDHEGGAGATLDDSNDDVDDLPPSRQISSPGLGSRNGHRLAAASALGSFHRNMSTRPKSSLSNNGGAGGSASASGAGGGGSTPGAATL
jgi:uncharacterized membrane protein YgcG